MTTSGNERRIHRGEILFALAIAASLAVCAGAQENTISLVAAGYESAEAARAVWESIEQSPPIEVTDEGYLRLPCNFDAHDRWRVAWDRAGQWDLSVSRRFIVDIVANPDHRLPVTGMILYLHSGDGWYSGKFTITDEDHRVTIHRNQFSSEGRTAGWHRVDRVRLTVKTSHPDAQAIHLKAVRAVVGEPKVGILQGDDGTGTDQAIVARSREMARRLNRMEVDSRTLDDESVAEATLRGLDVLILPSNPHLGDRASATIEQFVADGGKLIALGPLHESVAPILAVKPMGAIEEKDTFPGFTWRPTPSDDEEFIRALVGPAGRIVPEESAEVIGHWADGEGRVTDAPAVTRNANGYYLGRSLIDFASNKRADIENRVAADRMLLSMIGRLSPDAMRRWYERRRDEMGSATGFIGSSALEKAIEENLAANSDGQDARVALAAARLALAAAEKAAQEDDFATAGDRLDAARLAYLKSYALSVPSQPDEIRSMWICDSRGPNEWSWDVAMESMARGGYNTVMSFMLYAGGAAYDSKILPVVPLARDKDLLAEAVAAGKKHGIGVYAAKVNYTLWNNSRFWPRDEAFAKTLSSDRLQVDVSGESIDTHLCPSHPQNLEHEVATVLEVVRNYDIAGICLDYIRYNDEKRCYCDGCRRRFEEEYELKVENWPADVFSGDRKPSYRQFRRDQVTRLVAATSREAKAIRPDLQVTAAVLTNGPRARDTYGQDWRLWLDKGYLDFACPMTYETQIDAFEQSTRLDREWAGAHRLAPGIAECWLAGTDQTVRHVAILRRHGAVGFFLFQGDWIRPKMY